MTEIKIPDSVEYIETEPFIPEAEVKRPDFGSLNHKLGAIAMEEHGHYFVPDAPGDRGSNAHLPKLVEQQTPKFDKPDIVDLDAARQRPSEASRGLRAKANHSRPKNTRQAA